jgi:hypothetical protein
LLIRKDFGDEDDAEARIFRLSKIYIAFIEHANSRQSGEISALDSSLSGNHWREGI